MASREITRLKELAAALKAEPGSIPRRLELAAALRDARRPADAIDLYRGVAEAYAEEGRLVQAMAVCKGILEIDPEHRDTLEMLATLAQRRAARRGDGAVKQPDGRWVAAAGGSDEALARSDSDELRVPTQPRLPRIDPDRPLVSAFADPATRAGGDSDATRIGGEEVSAVRRAMWSQTPPGGVPALDESQMPELSIAPARDTDPTMGRAALDFDDDTKKHARGDKLLDLPPSDGEAPKDTIRMQALSDEELGLRRDTQDELPAIPVEPARTISNDETRAAVPSALATGRPPGEPTHLPPEPPPPIAPGDFIDEDTGGVVEDALTIPLPRPALLVEPPPFPLLSDLPRAAFLELVARLNVVHLETGATVLKEGDEGDACYLVVSGSVRVKKAGVEVAVLGPGSFFGEFAVLADQRRHASVEAVEPVELLEITRTLLDELVAAHPGVARTLRKFYRERLLQTLMATAPFFQRLQPEERASIAERFRPRRFGRGARVIEEGSPGGGLFLILVGEVEVVRGPEAEEVKLGTLGEGSYFGEMSLLKGGAASATVRATRMTEVVQLPPRDFYEIVSQHPVLWEQLRTEAERRELANHAIVAGEARKSDTIYLV